MTEQRVYLVDDDAAVLRSLRRLLEAAGLVTTAFDSPAEFLDAVSPAAAGCAGVVCSGQELEAVVQAAPNLYRVVPGIRPAGAELGDQKRVMTPALAIASGATHLVVGRPICAAEHPPTAADAIVAEIAGAL